MRAHRRSHPPCRTGAELWSAHCDPCTPNAPRCESGTANPILSPSQETGQCPKIQRKQPREPVRPPTPSERSTNPPPFVSSGDEYTCTDYFTNQNPPSNNQTKHLPIPRSSFSSAAQNSPGIRGEYPSFPQNRPHQFNNLPQNPPSHPNSPCYSLFEVPNV